MDGAEAADPIWFLDDPRLLESEEDTASFVSGTEESDGDGQEDQLSLEQHVRQNQDCFDALKQTSTITELPAGRFVLKKPTASNILSNCVHPACYRFCSDIRSLEELATLLRAPDDWILRVNKVISNGLVREAFEWFLELQDNDEEVRLLPFLL